MKQNKTNLNMRVEFCEKGVTWTRRKM